MWRAGGGTEERLHHRGHRGPRRKVRVQTSGGLIRGFSDVEGRSRLLGASRLGMTTVGDFIQKLGKVGQEKLVWVWCYRCGRGDTGARARSPVTVFLSD